MKKRLTNLTGIVFLLTVFFAGACNSADKKNDANQVIPDANDTTATQELIPPVIVCKAVEADNGSLQFTMWDLNEVFVAIPSPDDPLKFVADLHTDVQVSRIVRWKWSEKSQVTEFVEIVPKPPLGNIMPGNADPQTPDRKVFIYRIPHDATPGEAPYYIKFIWKGDTVTIDPYLKVPPTLR